MYTTLWHVHFLSRVEATRRNDLFRFLFGGAKDQKIKKELTST